MPVERADWSLPSTEVADVGNLPAPAGDAFAQDHPSADMSPAESFIDRVEAGLSEVDRGTLNGMVEGWSTGLQDKLRAALANPPLPGRAGRWLDKFEDNLTLAERAELWDEAEIDPEFTKRLLGALVK